MSFQSIWKIAAQTFLLQMQNINKKLPELSKLSQLA
jgi:hypothetical protein